MIQWRISEALTSFRRLEAVVNNMSEEEVVRAIALEEEGLRRSSILNRLNRRARAFGRANYQSALKARVNQEK